MAGARIAVEWNSEHLARVNAVFARLAQATDDLQPLYRDIGEYLLPAHQDRIAQGITPEGQPFAPLSEDYKKSKRKRESKGANAILILDDILHGYLAYQVSPDGLEVGTAPATRDYAATQQFGRPEAGIPARPFLGLSDADTDEIERILQDYLAEIIGD